MEPIAIFAALRWECRPVLRQMRAVRRERVAGFTAWRGVAAGQDVWLVKTGVGLQSAETAARVLSRARRFALFLSTGCAGALTPELAPGDVTVATEIIGNPSGRRFEVDANHRDHACRVAVRGGLRAIAAPIFCSPHVLTTAAAKCAIAAEHGAVAVEMEGAGIAACALQAGIPFASVRAIADTADTELPHAGRFTEPRSGALRPWALAGYLATHPGTWTDLLALQRMMHAAQSSLEKFFGAWFVEA